MSEQPHCETVAVVISSINPDDGCRVLLFQPSKRTEDKLECVLPSKIQVFRVLLEAMR